MQNLNQKEVQLMRTSLQSTIDLLYQHARHYSEEESKEIIKEADELQELYEKLKTKLEE